MLDFPPAIVYYPHMASVIEKRRADGRTYYYLVESARVDGKPRIVSQQYLGSAAEVAAKLAGASTGIPVRSQHKRFGDLAAVWSVLDRLGVVEVVDAATASVSRNPSSPLTTHPVNVTFWSSPPDDGPLAGPAWGYCWDAERPVMAQANARVAAKLIRFIRSSFFDAEVEAR